MTIQDASAVADLHRSAISTGFLTALGQRFVERVYQGVLSCPLSFGLGVRDEAGDVLAFIACADDIGQAYRHILRRNFFRMALPLIRHACRLSMLKRIWETLRYPADVEAVTLPAAEVLSIAVSSAARGRGLGQALMEAAFAEFRNRNIRHVKLAVGAANDGAIRFYERCGFRLALTRLHHGQPMNIYHVQLAEEGEPARPASSPRTTCPPTALPSSEDCVEPESN